MLLVSSPYSSLLHEEVLELALRARKDDLECLGHVEVCHLERGRCPLDIIAHAYQHVELVGSRLPKWLLNSRLGPRGGVAVTGEVPRLLLRIAVLEHGAVREVRGHLSEEGHQNRLAADIPQLAICLYELSKVCIGAIPVGENGEKLVVVVGEVVLDGGEEVGLHAVSSGVGHTEDLWALRTDFDAAGEKVRGQCERVVDLVHNKPHEHISPL